MTEKTKKYKERKEKKERNGNKDEICEGKINLLLERIQVRLFNEFSNITIKN